MKRALHTLRLLYDPSESHFQAANEAIKSQGPTEDGKYSEQ